MADWLLLLILISLLFMLLRESDKVRQEKKEKEKFISLLSTIKGFPCERGGQCLCPAYMEEMYDWGDCPDSARC